MDPATMAMIASFLYSVGKDQFGGGDQMTKVPVMDKNQKAIHAQIMQMLNPQGQLGQGYQQGIQHQMDLMNPNSEAVKQFTQPYMDQFNQETVPGLAERFAGAGAMGGGLSSSGFGQSLSAAGGNLQNQLAALKAQLGQGAAQNLMSQYGNMTGMGLGTPTFGYQQPQQGMFPSFLNAWAQGGFQMPGSGGGYQGSPQLTKKQFGIG